MREAPEPKDKNGVHINPVVAIDANMDVSGGRERVREELQSRIVRAVEQDQRYMEAKASIEQSGYIDDYMRHGITFHMVVDEDGMQLNSAASSQDFLDPDLLEEGYMGEDEFRSHTEKLRELADNDVPEITEVTNLL